MTGSDAAAIVRELLERFECVPTREKSQHLQRYGIDDEVFGRRLLEHALTSDLDGRVLRFFRSEYYVHWYSVTRAIPVPQVGLNSFRWHCDRGPRGHLKLLLYLNGFEEHGGSTELLDLETTRRLEASGYVYAPVKTRVHDLGPLAERFGARYEPWAPRMLAGEGLLFQPTSVLHRGLLPTAGPRYVVTVCLLPSPIPWRRALERRRHALGWRGREVARRRVRAAGPAGRGPRALEPGAGSAPVVPDATGPPRLPARRPPPCSSRSGGGRPPRPPAQSAPPGRREFPRRPNAPAARAWPRGAPRPRVRRGSFPAGSGGSRHASLPSGCRRPCSFHTSPGNSINNTAPSGLSRMASTIWSRSRAMATGVSWQGWKASSLRPADSADLRIDSRRAAYSPGRGISVGSQPSPKRPVRSSMRGPWAATKRRGARP